MRVRRYPVNIIHRANLIDILQNDIQEHLENPFDQVGEDDVVINAEKFVARL